MEPDAATEPRYWFEQTMRDREQFYRLAVAAGFPRRERNRKQKWYGTLPQHEIRHEPTPDEIAKVSAEIRAEWSESEELSRRAGSFRRVEWVLPEGA